MRTIIEGESKFNVHLADIPSKSMPVFFNPVKGFDRDLSVEFVKRFKPSNALDLLCASGARGIRLMKEAGVKVVFNDANPLAVKLTRSNLKLNHLRARVHNKDANQLLYDLGEYFDFIDLDPFGSPNPYLTSAIRFTARRGVLAVTATDTAALNGARPKACLRKYHSRVVRHPFMKETGLRVLIKHVVEKGAELELAMRPVMAHCTKHYYRAYFVKDLGAGRVDELLSNINYLYYNPETGYRGFARKSGCVELGPVYTGSINSLSVVPEWKREDGFPPWYFSSTEFGFNQEPKFNVLLDRFRAVRSHYLPKSFKTNFSFNQLISRKF